MQDEPSSIDAFEEQLRDRFRARTPRSAALYARALGSLPGGNTRTSTFFDPIHSSPTGRRGAGSTTWTGTSTCLALVGAHAETDYYQGAARLTLGSLAESARLCGAPTP